MLEIENAVFPENIVFSQKNIVFFVGMTFSSVLRLLVLEFLELILGF